MRTHWIRIALVAIAAMLLMGTGEAAAPGRIAFVTMVGTPEEERDAALLMDSIRAFASDAAKSSVYVVLADPARASGKLLKVRGAHVVPLERDKDTPPYMFLDKVRASAQVEALAEKDAVLLVWIDPRALVLSPLRELDLPSQQVAALRPVHLQNVGLLAGAAPDAFWSGVYRAAGVTPERIFPVQTFVDGKQIQAYFNTHIFAVRPQTRILRDWLTVFETLIRDGDFQKAACADDLHKIFLHQAVLSALIVARLDPAKIRILPPSYSYPLHLHDKVPLALRARRANDIAVLVHEDTLTDPAWLNVLPADEPLKGWLLKRMQTQPGSR